MKKYLSYCSPEPQGDSWDGDPITGVTAENLSNNKGDDD